MVKRRVDDDISRERIAEGLEIFSEYCGDLRIARSERLRHGGVSEAVGVRCVRHLRPRLDLYSERILSQQVAGEG